MYIGEYATSITTGRRVAIPKKFREELGEGELILTRGYEGCVVLVNRQSFEKLLVGVEELPFVVAGKRETSRFLLGGAHAVEPDTQGRVVLPESLRKHAGIADNDVVFVGVGVWIEIWDAGKWQNYQHVLDAEAEQIADRLVQPSA